MDPWCAGGAALRRRHEVQWIATDYVRSQRKTKRNPRGKIKTKTKNKKKTNIDVTVTFPDKLYDNAGGTSGPRPAAEEGEGQGRRGRTRRRSSGCGARSSRPMRRRRSTRGISSTWSPRLRARRSRRGGRSSWMTDGLDMCSCKRGFFTLRDCGNPATTSCELCTRRVCDEHLAPRVDTRVCVECAAKQDEGQTPQAQAQQAGAVAPGSRRRPAAGGGAAALGQPESRTRTRSWPATTLPLPPSLLQRLGLLPVVVGHLRPVLQRLRVPLLRRRQRRRRWGRVRRLLSTAAPLWLTETYPPSRGGMAESCDRIVRGAARGAA